jgi:Fe-S-cluster containining protein
LTNPNVCGQCSRMNRSCCTLRAEDNEGLPAPLSEAEIQRILNVLKNKNQEDIVDSRINTIQFVNQMSILFPDKADSVHKAFPVNEKHFELKTLEDTCIFQDIDGCILPNMARPNFCRIYPFWFLEDELLIFQDSSCLALENCQTIPEVLLSLGTRPEKLQQIYAQICEEWKLFHTKSKVKVQLSL